MYRERFLIDKYGLDSAEATPDLSDVIDIEAIDEIEAVDETPGGGDE